MALDCLIAVALAMFAYWRAQSGVCPVPAAIVVLSIAVAIRRPWPVPAFGVQLVAAVVAILIGVPGDAVVIGLSLGLYPLASGLASWPAVLALGGALAAVLGSGVATVTVPGLPLVAAVPGEETFVSSPLSVGGYSLVVLGAAWTLGRVVRARRADAAELRQLREQRAVGEERLRIARDVHDIVGHSLGLIAMKAAVAEHVAADRPDEGRAALSVIEQVSKDALHDVRTVLTALRDPDDPHPTLDGVDRLVANAEAAGLDVSVTRDVQQVPATVQASAYRIVQEALTNAARYAVPRRCALRIVQHAGTLAITATNPTTGTPRPHGHGLLGVRERAKAHGGQLSVESEHDGRFVVRVTLPLDPAAQQ